MKQQQKHKFNYRWTLKDAIFSKDKGNVFSCFACGGGGSTMGYKLAGYDVIGCNEIDHRMMHVYCQNHDPKYPFLEPIQEFKNRADLPVELYNLDILDGSPPCSTFSVAGSREDAIRAVRLSIARQRRILYEQLRAEQKNLFND